MQPTTQRQCAELRICTALLAAASPHLSPLGGTLLLASSVSSLTAEFTCPYTWALPLPLSLSPLTRYPIPEVAPSSLRTAVSQCTPGEYCVVGVRYPCPGGRYSAASGSVSCAVCPAGTYSQAWCYGCSHPVCRHASLSTHRVACVCLDMCDLTVHRLRMPNQDRGPECHHPWLHVALIVLPRRQ